MLNSSPDRAYEPAQLLQRVVSILDSFSVSEPLLTAARVRDLTGLPTTTSNRLLRNLVAQGLIQKDGDNFKLALRILGWSESAKAASSLLAMAGPVMEQLKNVSGETTALIVRNGSKRTVIAVCLSDKSLIFRPYVGQVMPLHAGSGGKVLLAFENEECAEIDLVKFTGFTITTQEALVAELHLTVRQGWAFAAQEREDGLNSVSAPVFDASRRLTAAITIGGPTFRMPAEKADEFGSMVLDAAHELSLLLGHTEMNFVRQINTNRWRQSDDCA